MEKGDIIYLNRGDYATIGKASTNFETKQPDGNYRFFVIKGKAKGLSFKLGIQECRFPKIKVEYQEIEGNGFLNFIDRVESKAEGEELNETLKELKDFEW